MAKIESSYYKLYTSIGDAMEATPADSYAPCDGQTPTVDSEQVGIPLTHREELLLKYSTNDFVRSMAVSIIKDEMTIYDESKKNTLLTNNADLAQYFEGVNQRLIDIIAKSKLTKVEYNKRKKILKRQQKQNRKIESNGHYFHSFEEAIAATVMHDYLEDWEIVEGQTHQIHASGNGKNITGDFVIGNKLVEYHNEWMFVKRKRKELNATKISQKNSSTYPGCKSDPVISSLVHKDYESFSKNYHDSKYGGKRLEVISDDPNFQNIEGVVIISSIIGTNLQPTNNSPIINLSLYDFIKSNKNTLKKELPSESEFLAEFRKLVKELKEKIAKEKYIEEQKNISESGSTINRS